MHFSVPEMQHLQHIPLADPVDVAGFHSEATRLLARQVPPDTVEWTAPATQAVGEHGFSPDIRATIRNRAARAIIPQSFVRMSELVVLHRDGDRFDLLYRSLWRLVYEPELKQDFGDADLARLRQMAQAVRRDIQKMKKRMEFRDEVLKGEPIAVCWYEPAHFTCEIVGNWLAGREPGQRWLLLTPDRSLRWDGARLLMAPALLPAQQPHQVTRDGWLQALQALPWL
jgi:probable DNA metabolism protein